MQRLFKPLNSILVKPAGPEHIHNRYRLMQNKKKGTWSRVVDKAKLLLDHGVKVNTLTVVTDYSVQFPEEIYEFHKGLGLNYMQFTPCVKTFKYCDFKFWYCLGFRVWDL